LRIRTWDEQIVKKIKGWFANSHFINEPGDVYDLRRIAAKADVDRSTRVWPAVAIYRMGPPKLDIAKNSWALASDRPVYSPTSGSSLNVVFVNLDYQLDVYAKSREAVDELSMELMIELYKHPTVAADLSQIDSSQPPVSVLLEIGDITDNSDLPNFRESLRLYSATIDFKGLFPVFRRATTDLIETIEVGFTTGDGTEISITDKGV